MLDELGKYQSEHLANFAALSFNILDFARVAKRDHVLKLMTIKALKDLDLHNIVAEAELVNFLGKICETYDVNVKYHNDLHGADVMQQAYFMLTTCQL